MMDCYLQDLINRPIRDDNRTTYFEIARWICVGSLFVSLILAYASSQNEILNIQYQMEQLRHGNEEILELNSALRAEYSSLLNPETFEHQAKKIGLIRSYHANVKIFDSPTTTHSESQIEILDIEHQMEKLRIKNKGLLELNSALRAKRTSFLNPAEKIFESDLSNERDSLN